jgi:hypothetical protein
MRCSSPKMPGSAIGSRRSATATRPLSGAHKRLNALLAHNMIIAPAGAPEDWRPANPPNGPYAVWAYDGGLDWVRSTYKLAATGDPRRLIQSCRANSPR